MRGILVALLFASHAWAGEEEPDRFRKLCNYVIGDKLCRGDFKIKNITKALKKKEEKKNGTINIMLVSTINAYRKICGQDDIHNSKLASHLEDVCKVVVNNNTCKGIDKDYLLDCDTIVEKQHGNEYQLLLGCTQGIIHSTKDTVVLAWDIVKWFWEEFRASGKISKVTNQAQEYAYIAKSYIHTEFTKNLDKSSNDFINSTQAAIKTAIVSPAEGLWNMFLEHTSSHFKGFECLNFKTKIYLGCKFFWDIKSLRDIGQ